ncbi:PLD nuclease N-terminal domain-containing protein [Pseudarthrobacter sp. J1738]|uniref:PLD nuclease N-terminal domain-containing protein n=1 Tax=unclassified Pseudarthrobacter TaxID=2647000 RepID=UPI003D2CF771
MPRVIGTILAIAIFVYALIDCIRTDRRAVRGISKTAWIVVMVLLPLLGAILWFIFGRPYPGPQQRRVTHTTAPDDDPEFLQNLERQRRNKAEADRLAKLRQELEERERRLKDTKATDTNDDAAEGS